MTAVGDGPGPAPSAARPVTAITGATGFVGGAFVAGLLARGWSAERLRVLVRDPARVAARGLPPASVVIGSLEDEAALRRAVCGAEVVVHIAGAVAVRRRADFAAVNAAGTARLVDAVRDAAPAARLVHVSSLAAAGPSRDGRGSAVLPTAAAPVSDYGRSKRDGELAVAALGDRQPWLILRPPIVFGPHDAASRLLFQQCRAPLVVVPSVPRPLSVLYIDDLVDALHRAVTAAVHGEVVPLDGAERVDTDSLPRRVAAACGRRARLVHAPLAAVWPAAVASDVYNRWARTPSVFGRDKLRDLGADGWVADPEPARRLLGFVARAELDDALRRTAAALGFGPRAAAAVRAAGAPAEPSARASDSRPGRRPPSAGRRAPRR